MGCCSSKPANVYSPPPSYAATVKAAPAPVAHQPSHITARYETYEQLLKALRKSGLEMCDIMFAIDGTKSNEWTGERTLNGRCLHSFQAGDVSDLENNFDRLNPYEQGISLVSKALGKFDGDGNIPMCVFGDSASTDKTVTVLSEGVRNGSEALECYRRGFDKSNLRLSGPTSFVPVIEHALNHVRKTRTFTILVIFTDGAVQDLKANIDAVVKASNLPLEIVIVGVGDGDDFKDMKGLDDEVAGRRFDNVQFVDMNKVRTVIRGAPNPHVAMAQEILAEVPTAYQQAKKRGVLAMQFANAI